MMKRQVWCVDEIRDILLAANQASGSAAALANSQNMERLLAYREGFKAALISVATALGMAPMVAREGPVESLADTRSN
jgi:hypothetical protein